MTIALRFQLTQFQPQQIIFSLQFVFCFSQHQNNNVTFQAPVDMMFNDFSNVKEQSTEIKDKQKSRLAI